MATLSPASSVATTLRPDYRLSLSILLMGLCVAPIQAIGGLVIALLGMFLIVQTTVIRLTFTDTELQVCRGTTILRRFPYADWQAWQVFWSAVPILFYFREVKSIHFLPMVFNAGELVDQLQQHCDPVGLNQ
ncbi:DUF3119 family protein [Leptolyngbyaceae cyanobacterium CCMR0082]|uniref:DUF3119 family protein n=2 Tax=Adonisia turfae TaxID=2950184 RepID=A0A6M0SCA3_9CYAN|nr:DUF3119 family protein [Adonisia turfae]MDV3350084.1 DUF3119 family protein [Leptothoe sp. LEGE 181152]NEZ59153.1 DUF3119 family protein [Adonisia turfae CCMR0081]NEZ65292.1 DUF3119 family protein [Adonisia turfae CCMR0082]